VGSGRLLPSTSVDQYVATMARWFGVEAGEMSGVIPNIGNFGGSGYPVDLGFMKP
jgi:nitrate/nitrite transporter NarK